MGDNQLPHIPVGQWASDGIDWLTTNAEWLFSFITRIGTFLVGGLSDLLTAVPWPVMIVVLALLAWAVRSWRLALGTVLALLLVVSMGQWETTMQTMALVLIAAAFAVVIGIPIGILAASSDTASTIIRPILDLMQTMPAFVYLIPAVTFFSIGVVPGLVATVIFSLPPGVRMTELGIRQVDTETVEAGESFGATKWQILRGIQLPLAVPTIMAGVNQVIMLALSMAVIAGMVGADGLGKEVVSSISTLNVAQGVEAGLSVVILAIYLDRLTGAIGRPTAHRRSLAALIRRQRRPKQS